MTLPRFQIVKTKTVGFLPYAVVDAHNDFEVIIWADDVREAAIAAKDYNQMIEQDQVLAEHFKKIGL